MRIEEFLADVDPQWRGPFQRFIDFGELDHGFEAELDRNVELQTVMDKVLQAQADEYYAIDAATPESEAAVLPLSGSGWSEEVGAVPDLLLAAGIAGMVRVPVDERPTVLQRTADRLESLVPEDTGVASQVVESIEQVLVPAA
jgi:hypothetical protein